MNYLAAVLARNERTRRVSLVLFSALVALAFLPFRAARSEGPPAVFELELPDFQVQPSSQPEITISSPNVNQVFIHVLKPAADNIDYGAITTNINGRASAPIAEVVAGVRGKIVKLDLKRLPGYQFINGRNTIEIWAQNRRGRMFYSSFVVKTATQEWNNEFTYRVEQAPGAKNEIPPQIILMEPQRAVEFPRAISNLNVLIKGIVTTTSDILRVSVDGKDIRFKVLAEESTRQLTRLSDSERSVAFETTSRIRATAPYVVVEAEDKLGSRMQVLVPVFTRKPGATPVNGQKFALIIGISRYKNNLKGIPNLKYADQDATAMYEFFQKRTGGGFTRENMLLLQNEQATTANIREALTHFITRASENDLLLIFFAGHGAPDPFYPQNLYVITYDTSVEAMEQTAFAMASLRKFVEQNVRSKRVVLLFDACHSAGLSSEGTRDLPNNLANLYLQNLLYQQEGRAIITSSDVNEASRESQKWGNGHGVFTYYLLEGLKGSADTNGDRLVSVGELFRYVQQKVRFDTRFQQNPRMVMGENENIALSVARLR
ncbi:MAG: hypothetical protein V7638_1402 [Acidobacteriota bacterium]